MAQNHFNPDDGPLPSLQQTVVRTVGRRSGHRQRRHLDPAHGPAMVVYPAGWWFGQMSEEKIDEVLNALDEGTEPPTDSMLFT